MRTILMATALVASVLAGALSATAAERAPAFDGAKFFQEQADRAGW